MTAPILVGVDGSPGNERALDWAVDTALLRQRELRLLHSAWVPMMEPAFVGREHLLRQSAAILEEDALARVRERAPELHVSTSLSYDPAANALVHASSDAELVVVGMRGRGGFPGKRLGSVSYKVAAHANCPVAVIGQERPVPTDPPQIVVGLDDSPHGRAALAAAFAEARMRTAHLRVVYAVRMPTDSLAEVLQHSGYEWDRLRAEYEFQAEQIIAGLRERHPEVPVTVSMRWDDATHALTQDSMAASLLVVGARGRHAFARWALGSVAHGVLNHAYSPVLVVHVTDA
ncbi:universal stress protein [Lipingzhangella sp. LS1_29]|uniref:Universal stress protein n=1 Tax=Lipingzhangella rawalii TaxID=2055835 RepID=A0ABU2H981_9ACTN|nr:universal stress protein [Lipingzhangella rawalii]MDS1271870.1 universal stress protein [Lipingzhangella rawalii]